MDKPTYAEDDVRLLKANLLPKPGSRIWRFFLLVRIDSLLSALKIPRKLFSAQRTIFLFSMVMVRWHLASGAFGSWEAREESDQNTCFSCGWALDLTENTQFNIWYIDLVPACTQMTKKNVGYPLLKATLLELLLDSVSCWLLQYLALNLRLKLVQNLMSPGVSFFFFQMCYSASWKIAQV